MYRSAEQPHRSCMTCHCLLGLYSLLSAVATALPHLCQWHITWAIIDFTLHYWGHFIISWQTSAVSDAVIYMLCKHSSSSEISTSRVCIVLAVGVCFRDNMLSLSKIRKHLLNIQCRTHHGICWMFPLFSCLFVYDQPPLHGKSCEL